MACTTIEISGETNARLNDISLKYGITKVEAIRRALNLLNVVAEEKARNHDLAIVEKDTLKPVARLVDIL